MSQLFISHSSKDNGFVRELHRALANHKLDAWIDSRELFAGLLLTPSIKKAIKNAGAFIVVVSQESLQSRWVGKELKHALKLQKQRGANNYPVIPLALNATKLGVMEDYFAGEPTYISVSSNPGGIEAALPKILAALGKQLLTDTAPTPTPLADPLEDLVLELTDLKIHTQDQTRRASARARLVYKPAATGKRDVSSQQNWRFISPLGPLEADDIRWYLEQYAVWPGEMFKPRAQQIEAKLSTWGQQLYQAALPPEATTEALQAWRQATSPVNRRFSVSIDAAVELGAAAAEQDSAKQAATLLLSLPWELLHDGKSYLFQGAKASRVRRCLPNTQDVTVAAVAPPIRILLITARPEDPACSYLDHRASALPLVAAMETLGSLVELTLLSPATLPALRLALEQAQGLGAPYHVVHFDGHGVYDAKVGLGGLCFEDPQDQHLLVNRRHLTVYTTELGPLLRDYRIPLVFLDACQTAAAEQASESVASELLKLGVASVVAMSHSVLVATAGIFVQAFYRALAEGKRVGAAMLAGQQQLHDDSLRGHIFGVGELRLQDWFVPVLFQEQHDPQLFQAAAVSPASQARIQEALKNRMGKIIPDEPTPEFVGRSKDLLRLERLLLQPDSPDRYAILRGQGGEGKTALAVEFARWLVRSKQIQRAAFVSVETHTQAKALLDALGQQLLPSYSVAAYPDLDQAIQPVQRALLEQTTLVVIDNLESILLPPYLAASTQTELNDDLKQELAAILAVCAQLNSVGHTRLLFTSREALPAPFDNPQQLIELQRLDREDAVKLIERLLNQDRISSAAHAQREAIEQLVDAVHGHARTLALLAPSLRSLGVTKTHAQLTALMADMHKKFPADREHSLYASVALSLQRLSAESQNKVQVLGVFHGGVHLVVLQIMMDWEPQEVEALAYELIATGLATANPFNYLSLNPALCPYLRAQCPTAQQAELTERWAAAMLGYVEYLAQQASKNVELAATLTLLDLANFLALLAHIQQAGDAAATIDLTTTLYRLLHNLGKPALLNRVGQARDAAAAKLGAEWNHAHFEAQGTRIEQQLAGGQISAALAAAETLLHSARAAGADCYPVADYDLAMACFLLGRVVKTAGGAEPAQPLLAEAQQRFEAIAEQRQDRGAEKMASVCLTDAGDCLRHLGRLDAAAQAYEQAIHRAESLSDERQVAVGKIQLGSVRLAQRRYQEALTAYSEARAVFNRLNDLGTVAGSWHQTGMAYQDAGQPEAAEQAYRQALAINVQLGNAAGQVLTLIQLGNLYAEALARPEDAASFYQQAAEIYAKIGDLANEGRARNNLGDTLCKLGRLDAARQAIRRAITCYAQFGHAAQPWTAWIILADIETAANQPHAAAAAKAKALACYLAYRRDGGENHYDDGRIALAVTLALQAADPAAALAIIQDNLDLPELPDWLRPLLHALHAIAAGSRDPQLAAAPELHYISAAEILLLLETLAAPTLHG